MRAFQLMGTEESISALKLVFLTALLCVLFTRSARGACKMPALAADPRFVSISGGCSQRPQTQIYEIDNFRLHSLLWTDSPAAVLCGVTTYESVTRMECVLNGDEKSSLCPPPDCLSLLTFFGSADDRGNCGMPASKKTRKPRYGMQSETNLLITPPSASG
jgi:hypothetical protein